MAEKKSRTHARMALAIIFLVLASAAYVLGWSSLFTVKQVVVIGAPNPSETFAIEHSIHLGQKMARFESQSLAKSLEEYTWLDHSNVSRNWLKGVVTVHVWTRTPVAQFQSHLVDDAGIVFDLPSVDASHLPIITGSNNEAAKFAANVLTKMPTQLRSQVTGILVHGIDSAILSINEPTLKRVLTVAWGDETHVSLKVQVYQALVALPENSKITKMDLSAPDAPIVK